KDPPQAPVRRIERSAVNKERACIDPVRRPLISVRMPTRSVRIPPGSLPIHRTSRPCLVSRLDRSAVGIDLPYSHFIKGQRTCFIGAYDPCTPEGLHRR